MNGNFREWYLDVCPNPSEGQVEKRIACIENFAENAAIEDIKFLLNLYGKRTVSSWISSSNRLLKWTPRFQRNTKKN